MDVFIGSIALFPYHFVPAGWVGCHGQELEIQHHQALFSLVTTRFGGDGQKHFKLPDLRDKAPSPHLQYCISMGGAYPPRE